jgi:predicted subunit of tRNA(5-methylaminomethyl-2-thiouridylate) methyltransferase
MTIKDVEEYLTKIAHYISAEKYESAHLIEDLLYEKALHAVSIGVHDSDKIAALALTTKHFKYPRSYS